jgi:hypothetical protein
MLKVARFNGLSRIFRAEVIYPQAQPTVFRKCRKGTDRTKEDPMKLAFEKFQLAVGGLVLTLAACGGNPAEDKDDGDKDDEEAPVEPIVLGDPSYTPQSFSEVQITDGADSLSSEFPKIIFNGTDYSLLWVADGGRHVKFQKMSKEGVRAGEAKTIFKTADCTGPKAHLCIVTEARYDWARNDAGHYLIALTMEGLYWGLIQEDGTVVKAFSKVLPDGDSNTDGGFPSVASDGTDFVIAYATHRGAGSPSLIKAWKINGTDGEKATAAPVELSSGTTNFKPSIAWNAAKGVYGVVWDKTEGASSSSEVAFASINAAGVKVTSEVLVTQKDTKDSSDPVLAAEGDGFGVVFRDSRDFNLNPKNPISGIPYVRLALLSDKGVVLDTNGDGAANEDDHYIVSNPEEGAVMHLALAAKGEEWGIAWSMQSEPKDMFYAQAKLASGKLTHSVKQKISGEGAGAANPTIATDGTKFFTVWMDVRGEAGYQVWGAK